MSNAQKAKGKPFSLANYASEAQEKPVEFWVDDDTMLTIERPTGEQMFEVEAAMRSNDSKAILKALCGKDVGQQLIDMFGPLPAKALRDFTGDLQERLGLLE